MLTLPSIADEWLYPESLTAAAAIQKLLATRVRLLDELPQPVRVVAGVDVSNLPRDPAELIYAAIVLLDAQTLQPIGQGHGVMKAPLPYVSGFLAFREIPAILRAYAQLPVEPDLLFVDGHGVSHPRGLGIASHLGVLLDRPTIGVAKSILTGQPAGPLGECPGDAVEIVRRGQTIATALRTRRGSNPLYIAPGHRISPETAMRWVQKTLTTYKLPEPTRLAHQAANRFRLEHSAAISNSPMQSLLALE